MWHIHLNVSRNSGKELNTADLCLHSTGAHDLAQPVRLDIINAIEHGLKKRQKHSIQNAIRNPQILIKNVLN